MLVIIQPSGKYTTNYFEQKQRRVEIATIKTICAYISGEEHHSLLIKITSFI